MLKRSESLTSAGAARCTICAGDSVADAYGLRKKHGILAKTIAGTKKTTKRHVAMLQAPRCGVRDTMVRIPGETARATVSGKVPVFSVI